MAADEFKASYIQACEAKAVKPRDELIAVLNSAAATGCDMGAYVRAACVRVLTSPCIVVVLCVMPCVCLLAGWLAARRS